MSTNKNLAHKISPEDQERMHQLVSEFQDKLAAAGLNFKLEKLSFSSDPGRALICDCGTELVINPDGSRYLRCKRCRPAIR